MPTVTTLKKLHKAVVGEELADLVDCLMCNRLYNVRRQSKLKNIAHKRFGPNEMDGFCDVAKQ